MMKFSEMDMHIENNDMQWCDLVKNAHRIMFYDNVGSLLYLTNTSKIEDLFVKKQNQLNNGCKYEHTDKLWDSYYPEIKNKNNGPDVKVTDANGDVYYIEIKHFYDTNVITSTMDYYCNVYKYGIDVASQCYPKNYYVCDYRDKGYDTRYMIFCEVDGAYLYYTWVEVATGNIIKTDVYPNNIDLWEIDDHHKINKNRNAHK